MELVQQTVLGERGKGKKGEGVEEGGRRGVKRGGREMRGG